jgi:hypothetical protein
MAAEKSVQWTEEQRDYMRYLMLPKDQRTPSTMTGYAAHHGMTVHVLYGWQNLPGFRTAIREMLRAELEDDVPAVLKEIARRARKGEVQFVDRFLSLMGASDIVAGANARRIDNTMSDDDAARILQRAIPALATTRATIIAQGGESDMSIVMDETN